MFGIYCKVEQASRLLKTTGTVVLLFTETHPNLVLLPSLNPSDLL
jgi:hypothetical protein